MLFKAFQGLGMLKLDRQDGVLTVKLESGRTFVARLGKALTKRQRLVGESLTGDQQALCHPAGPADS